MGIHFFLSFLCNKLLGKCLIKKCQLSDSNAGHRWYKKQQRHHNCCPTEKTSLWSYSSEFWIGASEGNINFGKSIARIGFDDQVASQEGQTLNSRWKREREREYMREKEILWHCIVNLEKERRENYPHFSCAFDIGSHLHLQLPLSLSLSLCIFCTSLRNYTHTIFPYLYHCVSTFFPILQLRFWQWNKR